MKVVFILFSLIQLISLEATHNPLAPMKLVQRADPFGLNFLPAFFGMPQNLFNHLGSFDLGGEWTETDTPTKITIHGDLGKNEDPEKFFAEPQGKVIRIKMQEKSVNREQHGDDDMVGSQTESSRQKTFVLPFEVTAKDIKKTIGEKSVTFEIDVPKGVEVKEGVHSPSMSFSAYSFSSSTGSPFGGQKNGDFEVNEMKERNSDVNEMKDKKNGNFLQPLKSLHNLNDFGSPFMDISRILENFGMNQGQGQEYSHEISTNSVLPRGKNSAQIIESNNNNNNNDNYSDDADFDINESNRGSPIDPFLSHFFQPFAPFLGGGRAAVLRGGGPSAGPAGVVGGGGFPSTGMVNQGSLPVIRTSPFMGNSPLMGMFGPMMGPMFGSQMRQSRGFGSLDDIFESKKKSGQWTEQKTPKSIIITGVLSDDVDPSDVSITVSRNMVKVTNSIETKTKQSDKSNSFISGSNENQHETRIFILPFETDDKQLATNFDSSKRTITITIPVPEGVNIIDEDLPSDAVETSFSSQKLTLGEDSLKLTDNNSNNSTTNNQNKTISI